MLESLQIRNFAIIDALQLEFDRGLTALTGETGAGKSILLDALKLVAGDRADSDSIRTGCDRAEISACFDLTDCPSARDWLEHNEMLADGECVIRRILSSGGRSKAFINGASATLTQLRELCDRLVDIHGQHEHQSLQKAAVQRELLDAFVGERRLLGEVAQKYATLRDLEQHLQQAEAGAREREQRIDLLQLYCEEMAQLDPAGVDFDGLLAEFRRLSNAESLLQQSGDALARLYEDENHNVQAALSQCVRELAELAATDGGLAASHELLNGALIQVQEAVAELRAYRDAIEIDDARLDAVNQRIAGLQSLARKHRVEVGELAPLAQSLAAELDELQGDAYDVDALQARLEQARADYAFSADELSRKRRQTAASLSEQISQVMQQLGMSGGRFIIEVEADDPPSAHGSDRIRYLVSANPGQPPKTLARVASGGELSRISLAIQVIMSESSLIPTLIFDEVDSGVGGGVAEIVGRKLRELGRDRQVFCVTHLPQVASQAHHHFRVEKLSGDGDTRTDVTSLDADARLEEIARMLGGVEITAQTRAHANEMINAAE
ncbi:MAG: DNA repair protein RecN [Gammaproteobacteria bacterium]|nr:DNA repair protein RecN [Gammaproteobacteria bacterium]